MLAVLAGVCPGIVATFDGDFLAAFLAGSGCFGGGAVELTMLPPLPWSRTSCTCRVFLGPVFSFKANFTV